MGQAFSTVRAGLDPASPGVFGHQVADRRYHRALPSSTEEYQEAPAQERPRIRFRRHLKVGGNATIVVNLDVILAKRKRRLNELADEIGISVPNLSILKTGKARAIRFSTLDAICRALECQPADILEYRPDPPAGDSTSPSAKDG